MSISSKVGVLLVVVAIILTATAPAHAIAEPVQDQQCREDPIWRKLHPQICDPYRGGPFGIGGTRGGGGDDGLLGTIGRVLGGLGGGLL